MKMQKRILTTLLSRLASLRSQLTSSDFTGSMGDSLFSWLYRIRTSRGVWSLKRAQSRQYRPNEYLKGEDNRQQIVFSHTSCSSTLRIGVLDDNRGVLRLIETILTMEGHAVSTYTDGSSLLDVLSLQEAKEQPPYDLVILDLLLLGAQSGADVFFAIRQQFSAEVLPIIVITAVDEPTLRQFRHILPDDVPLLRKPFVPRKLCRLIAQLTAGGKGE
jgi:CheY-like chemotaxis protein